MSFCAASFCTCSPKASFASATSASSPTAAAPLSCRFAFNYSARSRRQNNKDRLPRNRALFGAVLNVADPWWFSKDLLRPNSNFVLRPGSRSRGIGLSIPILLPSVSPNTYRPRALSLPFYQASGFELSLANYNRTKSACAPVTSMSDSPSLSHHGHTIEFA